MLSKQNSYDVERKLETIVGQLDSFLYNVEGVTYMVARIKTTENQIVTATGYLPLNSGILYKIKGEWVEHPKYGKQLKVLDCDIYREFSMTKEHIVNYLSSRLFDGIGLIKAQQIYEKFGEESMSIIEKEPEKLTCIKGITERTVELIKASYAKNVQYRSLTLHLGTNGISDNLINKIYNKYTVNALNIVKNNPYQLAYEIDGISFKTADKIALKDDPSKYHSSQRIQAGLYFALQEKCAQTGDLYMNFVELENKASELLNTISGDIIADREVNNALRFMCQDKKIILRDENFYISRYYYEERSAVMETVDLMKEQNPFVFSSNNIEKEMKKIEKSEGIEYSEQQKKAIKTALQNSISIITGGPGTGKSTIINAIIKIFDKLTTKDISIVPCAPTGKAAKRMQEITKKSSSTIHRVLEVNGETGKFIYNKDNPLPAGLYIVDEFSMVDISLYRSFISAIDKTASKVVIVGDKDQLPSVGPGNVLKDLLSSEYVPTVVLDKIFRQAMQSKIIVNAHKINQGDVKLEFCKDDFVWAKVNDNVDSATIFDYIVKRYKYEMDLTDTRPQILTPTRKNSRKISVDSLNPKLSEIANPKNQTLKIFEKNNMDFHVSDVVMQVKNNYSKMAFNGETGIISRLEMEGNKKIAIVDFGDNREIEYVSAEELDLAYATTIHKSQGSEYDTVIIPIVNQDIFQLDRSILYTAITRAKKRCVIIGTKKALLKAIKTTKSNNRRSNMANDLRKYYNLGVLQNHSEFDAEKLQKVLSKYDRVLDN